jgi:hypothetical protein
VIRPDLVCRWTVRSLSSRTRTVTLPEVVPSRISLRRGLSRSQVIEPETVRACTRSAGLSARISSPETVSMVRSSATPSASTGPEISLATVRPPSPISVMRPEVTSTNVSWRRPEAITVPSMRWRSARASIGTAIETSTRWRRPNWISQRRKPGHLGIRSCRTESRPPRSSTMIGLVPALAISTRAGPSVPTTLSRPDMRYTSRRETGSSKLNRCGASTVQVGMPLSLTRYIAICQSHVAT